MFKKRISILFLTGFLLFATLWHQFRQAASVTAALSSAFIQEFPLPNAGTPRQLIYDNHAFWFTDPGANVIGRFVYTSTIDYSFNFYTIPTANSEPYDLVIDGDVLWFTELAGNKIGKLTISTGQVEDFDIPTDNSAPTGITVTPNGDVWFVQRSGNNLTKFDPQAESFMEYLYNKSNALMEDVAATPGGDVLWFTAPGVNRVGSYTINSAAFFDVPVANFNTPLYTPSQIIVDALGDSWVSTKEGVVGHLKPATVQLFRFYPIASDNTSLEGLFLTMQGSNPQLWFTGSTTGSAGQLLTESDGSTINKWIFPVAAAAGGELYGIVAMDDGTVWLADYANGRLLRWSSPYFLSAYLPLVKKE
jgi:virginiamycin B lyase